MTFGPEFHLPLEVCVQNVAGQLVARVNVLYDAAEKLDGRIGEANITTDVYVTYQPSNANMPYPNATLLACPRMREESIVGIAGIRVHRPIIENDHNGTAELIIERFSRDQEQWLRCERYLLRAGRLVGFKDSEDYRRRWQNRGSLPELTADELELMTDIAACLAQYDLRLQNTKRTETFDF